MKVRVKPLAKAAENQHEMFQRIPCKIPRSDQGTGSVARIFAMMSSEVKPSAAAS